jgi:hypothetical protein
MSITTPTCEQFSVAFERWARALAPAIAIAILTAHLTYDAGHALGAWVHRLNDWLAGKPDPAPEPVPILTGAELIALWGARIPPEDEMPRKRPAARRKPAKARRVAKVA